jgi:crossover junction endodeoxyribonuclease RuvC
LCLSTQKFLAINSGRKNSMIHIGIDPGLRTGAAAAIDHNGKVLGCVDIPADGNKIDVISLNTLLWQMIPKGDDFCITIEEVGVMPGQGISSSGRFMRAAGAIETVGILMAKKVLMVRPQAWKKALGVTSDKETSLALARELFPAASLARKKDHGRAEALLIAEYSRRQA